MTLEEWKPVIGYESKYEVSSLGEVRSIPRTVTRSNGWPLPVSGRVLKQRKDRSGYLAVHLKDDSGHEMLVPIHRLVAKNFIDNPNNYPFVLHGPQGRFVNTVDNLSWGDPLKNMQDRFRDGTDNRSIKTHCAKDHEFTPENTRYYKGVRKCIKCAREWCELTREQSRKNPLPEDSPRHGTITGYTSHVCRCEKCKKAKNDYDISYRERKRSERQKRNG